MQESSTTHPHDGITRLAIDLPCEQCGYNLRTQPMPGACPECGQTFDAVWVLSVVRPMPTKQAKGLVTGLRVLLLGPVALLAWTLLFMWTPVGQILVITGLVLIWPATIVWSSHLIARHGVHSTDRLAAWLRWGVRLSAWLAAAAWLQWSFYIPRLLATFLSPDIRPVLSLSALYVTVLLLTLARLARRLHQPADAWRCAGAAVVIWATTAMVWALPPWFVLFLALAALATTGAIAGIARRLNQLIARWPTDHPATHLP